jgi:hypothetical protein
VGLEKRGNPSLFVFQKKKKIKTNNSKNKTIIIRGSLNALDVLGCTSHGLKFFSKLINSKQIQTAGNVLS